MGEEKIGLPIIWTQRANQQFDDVLEYWIERNKSNAYALKLNYSNFSNGLKPASLFHLSLSLLCSNGF